MYIICLRNITISLNDDKTSTRVMIGCFCPPHQITEFQYYTYDTEQILIWNNIKINAQ